MLNVFSPNSPPGSLTFVIHAQPADFCWGCGVRAPAYFPPLMFRLSPGQGSTQIPSLTVKGALNSPRYGSAKQNQPPRQEAGRPGVDPCRRARACPGLGAPLRAGVLLPVVHVGPGLPPGGAVRVLWEADEDDPAPRGSVRGRPSSRPSLSGDDPLRLLPALPRAPLCQGGLRSPQHRQP